MNTYVDEFLQILIQVGKIVLAARVFRNQLLLPLQQFLTTLLQTLTLGSLVLDARIHELVLVVGRAVRVLREKLFHRNQRQLLVLVAI